MYLELYFQFSRLNKHFSRKIEKFASSVPHPLVMTLAGLAAFCVLTKPYIFAGATTDGSINLLQLLSKTLFSVHF